MRTTPLLLLLACGAPTPPEGADTTLGETDVDSETETPTESAAPTTWRSALYPADWTPEFTTADGQFLHDHSYAGYRAGEAELPTTWPEPVVSVLQHGADPTGVEDSADAIQAAIDGLTEGGTVHLPSGTYVIGHRLDVRTSGVVITGDGPDVTRLHFTQADNLGAESGIRFAGGGPADEATWPLVDNGASRSRTVRLVNTEGLSVGDGVTVGFTITPAFVEDHGMTGTWTAFVGQHRPFFRRTIVAIDGDTVTLDVPLRYPALLRDGAELRRDATYLNEVGLQALAVSSVVEITTAIAHDRHHAIEFDRVADAWVRAVVSWDPDGDGDHLQSGGLYIQRSRRVTVADAWMGPAQNRRSGGNGYLYEISRSNDVLIRDSVGVGGRHNFIVNWDFGTNGCVFLRTTSREGLADNGPFDVVGFSEFHHSLAMANLIDQSVVQDGWQSKNRHGYSSGAGHAGTQNTFWNLTGSGELWSMQWDRGYVVGTGPELRVVVDPSTLDLTFGGVGTEPVDFAEGVGQAATLDPPSLYEDQLRRRLGR